MKKAATVIFLITLLSLLTSSVLNHNTKMIIRLARHGARSPAKPNKFGLEWIGIKHDYDYAELIPAGYL